MAQIYIVQLTEGNSEGNYDIYYNQVGSAFYATATTNNTLTSNLTFTTLSTPFQIAIPNSATKIIIRGLGECNNLFEYPVTPVIEPPPQYNFPILCFSYGEGSITEYLTFQPGNNLFNDKGIWTSGSYTISWNIVTQRWELVISSLLTFVSTVTSSDGVPNGTWIGLGTFGQNFVTDITIGICNPVVTLDTVLEQIPNSCLSTPKRQVSSTSCDGMINVIRTTGGQPPYLYSIDGTNFQTFNTFRNLCAGNFTITTKDSRGNITTDTIEVEPGTQPTTYTLALNARQTTVVDQPTSKQVNTQWRIVFPSGMIGITFDLNITFTSVITIKNPGKATCVESNEVYYNGELQTPYSTNSISLVSQRNDCSLYNQTAYTYVSTYSVSYSQNDTVNGIYYPLMSLPTPLSQNGCATGVEVITTLSVQVLNVSCSCCQVQSFEPSEIINDSLNATTTVTYNEFCLSFGDTCQSANNPTINYF